MAASSATFTAPPPEESFGRRLRDAHLGSLLAGVSLLFGVLKVLSVARFDITTAQGIVAESATATLLLGVLIRALPAVLLAILVGLLALVDDDATPAQDRRFYRPLTAIVCVLAAATQAPLMALMLGLIAWTILGWPGSARFFGWARPGDRQHQQRVADTKRASEEIHEAVEAIPALLAELKEADAVVEAAMMNPDTPEKMKALLAHREQVMARLGELVALYEKAEATRAEWDEIIAADDIRLSRMKATRPRTKRVLTIGVILFSVEAAVLMLDSRPWLPAEHLALDGQSAVIGYVIKASPEETVVLEEKSRHLVRLDGEKVTARRYCEVGAPPNGFFQPVLALVFDPDLYPRCNSLGP